MGIRRNRREPLLTAPTSRVGEPVPGTPLVSDEQLREWVTQVTQIRQHVEAANRLYERIQSAVTDFGNQVSELADRIEVAAATVGEKLTAAAAPEPPAPGGSASRSPASPRPARSSTGGRTGAKRG